MQDDWTSRFVPGFYQFHLDNYGHRKSVAEVAETSINAAGGHSAVDYQKIKEKFSLQSTRLKTLKGYVSRVVPTYQLLELFRDTEFGVPRGKVLDIGCGRGIHLRLLKGWGYIDEATGIDIYDHCTGFDESSLPRMHRRFRYLKHAETLQDRIARKPRDQWSETEYSIMDKIPTVRRFASDYGHRPDRGVYAMRMTRAPKMDRFIAGNVFELDGKYDLVTSFASLDWFSAEELMTKVASMLTDGGFFYAWVTNWWHAINTTNAFGHFPFAAQRMPKAAFETYVRATMPEHADTIMKSYSYFDAKRPTLADLVEIGGRCGLVPLTWKQNILPDMARPRGGISSLGVARMDHGEFVRAHADIREVDPAVRQADMYPYSNAILFQKVDPAARFDAESLGRLSASMRPKTGKRGLLRTLGGRIYQKLT